MNISKLTRESQAGLGHGKLTKTLVGPTPEQR